jgi:peptide/nickel transport system permease protein
MGAYLLTRLLQTCVTLFVISVIVFIITMQLPGDPALAYVGSEGASEELVEHYRHKLGLDRPIFVQYLRWLQTFVQGDLGKSVRTRVPVTTLLVQRFPLTLQLLLMGLTFALLLAIPIGVVSAMKPNTWINTVGTVIAVSGVSIPRFLVGMILILIFSLKLGWLPSSGYVRPFENFYLSIISLIMPSIALGGMLSAELMRQLRSALLEVMGEDYINTARAKGLREMKVIFKHAFRNALIPVVTLLTMRIGRLIGGIVIIEKVFSLPGIGMLMLNGVIFQDYPVIQTGMMVIALSVTFMNLLADVSYAFLDPRIKYH